LEQITHSQSTVKFIIFKEFYGTLFYCKRPQARRYFWDITKNKRQSLLFCCYYMVTLLNCNFFSFRFESFVNCIKYCLSFFFYL
jgi:hypothetical protein